MVHSNITKPIFQDVCNRSQCSRMKVFSSNGHDFKKLSELAKTTRSSYNSAYFKNVFLTILTVVKNIKVLLILWHTYPFLTVASNSFIHFIHFYLFQMCFLYHVNTKVFIIPWYTHPLLKN